MNDKISGSKSQQGKDKPSAELSRDERLAAALRANLQRRKAQSRARAAETGDEAEGNE
ncbi:hypothetical protein [Sedimentimonas flavescens]|uniref:hypothetical protein n=1 Tax=Sedimentimonas flavescens TaxID=2851012 RepID=UPI001C49FBC3|nr:hypothetical protein [Sedimentimonas flavescens]MBW0158876.1 hypothetical protein [Sedimentimonas flavescens]